MNKRASVNHDVDTLTEEQQRRAFGNDVRQAPNKIIRSVLY